MNINACRVLELTKITKLSVIIKESCCKIAFVQDIGYGYPYIF